MNNAALAVASRGEETLATAWHAAQVLAACEEAGRRCEIERVPAGWKVREIGVIR